MSSAIEQLQTMNLRLGEEASLYAEFSDTLGAPRLPVASPTWFTSTACVSILSATDSLALIRGDAVGYAVISLVTTVGTKFFQVNVYNAPVEPLNGISIKPASRATAT